MFKGDEDLIVGARNGPPLAVGHGEGEMFSAPMPLRWRPSPTRSPISTTATGRSSAATNRQIFDMDGNPVERKRQQSVGTTYPRRQGQLPPLHGKGDPRAAGGDRRTRWRTISTSPRATPSRSNLPFDFADIDRLAVSACGTAYLRRLVGKYWFERYARLPVDIDVASEFRYREMPFSKKSAAFFVSQSGETADTLASLRYCRKEGVPIGAIVNVRESTMARESDVVLSDACRPGDRRRLDQGLHLPAHGAGLADHAGRLGTRHDHGAKKKRRWCAAWPSAALCCPGAQAREARSRRFRASCRVQARALSRPRHQLSARHGRRAEAQGNLLHSCRRLCGR
jgi:hypothetical protein